MASWFARLIGKPEGVESPDSFWQRAISDTEPRLTPEIILAGREQVCEAFEDWAEDHNPILRIKADTREEALLLLAAWARQEGGPAEEFLCANAIIVYSEEAWRQATAGNRPLILIPLLDGGASLGLGDATGRGHWIVVSSGWEAREERGMIIAPWLDRERLQAALMRAGLAEVRAHRIVRNCGRSLQVLMRQLSMAPERRTPAWARREEAKALVPLLFAGRWQCNREGDRAVIAELAGCSYEEAERNVSRWLHEPDPLVRRYGDVFLLTSPLDAWCRLGRHVPQPAWQRYREVLTTLLKRRDPVLDLPPDQRWAASWHGKEHPESDELREGLVEQLARLVGAEDRIGLSVNPSPASVAQRVLAECLSPADDVERWLSIKEYLPDLAEAAPNVWLDSLERLLAKDGAAASLFEDSALFSTSPHVHVMWAIERLRWFLEHLARCAEALVQLSALDPGSNSQPRPSSVFEETFCLVKPENNVSFEDHFTILKRLAARHPQRIWPLLAVLLPQDRWRIVNYGPRFRSVSVEIDAPKTWGELDGRVQRLVEFLIELADGQSARWAELMKDIHHLPPQARSTLVISLTKIAPQFKNDGRLTELYHELMRLVRQHRVYSDADWALPANETDRIQELARTLQPADPVEVHSWLFCDPLLHLDLECSPESLQEIKLAAVNEVLAAGGQGGLARLAEKAAHPGLVGQTAAAATTTDEQKGSLLTFFLDHADGHFHAVVRCFVEEIFRDEGSSLTDFIAKYGCGIEGRLFSVFALGLPVCSETWDAVEAHGEEAAAAYWKSGIFLPQQDAALVARAVRAMLRHDQVAAAVRTLAYSECAVSSEVVLEALRRVPAFLNELRDARPDSFTYWIERLFKILDSNSDVADQELVNLEIAFFSLLKHTNRSSSAILRYARQNPEFFVELLRLQFRRRDGEEDDDLKVLSNERRKQLFDVAFDILHEFDAIPGLDGTGPQATQHMRSWISHVLQAAAQVGRREVAEEKIGGALARAPASKGEPWPPDHVCDTVEEFWSEHLATGLHCGCVNKLGFRSIDAGEPDKALAAQCSAWIVRSAIRMFASFSISSRRTFLPKGDATRWMRS